MKITFLGTRGSMPTGGKEYMKYGADTSSYLAESKDTKIFIDGGSGICRASEITGKEVSILLSHVHLDHLLGLPFFPYLKEEVKINIYSEMPGIALKSTVDRLFSEPFWPCRLEDYKAEIEYKSLANETVIGDFKVRYMEGNHPGGCVIYRLENEKKALVIATDYEHGTVDGEFTEFAKDADIIIYDGQYREDEYEKYKGFGHSTKEKGIELFKKTGAKRIIFTHHDPSHTDEYLEREEERIKALCKEASLAKQGEIIIL